MATCQVEFHAPLQPGTAVDADLVVAVPQKAKKGVEVAASGAKLRLRGEASGKWRVGSWTRRFCCIPTFILQLFEATWRAFTYFLLYTACGRCLFCLCMVLCDGDSRRPWRPSRSQIRQQRRDAKRFLRAIQGPGPSRGAPAPSAEEMAEEARAASEDTDPTFECCGLPNDGDSCCGPEWCGPRSSEDEWMICTLPRAMPCCGCCCCIQDRPQLESLIDVELPLILPPADRKVAPGGTLRMPFRLTLPADLPPAFEYNVELPDCMPADELEDKVQPPTDFWCLTGPFAYCRRAWGTHSAYGEVQYKLVGEVPFSGVFTSNVEVKQPVPVLSRPTPTLNSPGQLEQTAQFKGAGGVLTAKGRLAKFAYAPGEEIRVALSAENRTQRATVRLQVALRHRYVFSFEATDCGCPQRTRTAWQLLQQESVRMVLPVGASDSFDHSLVIKEAKALAHDIEASGMVQRSTEFVARIFIEDEYEPLELVWRIEPIVPAPAGPQAGGGGETAFEPSSVPATQVGFAGPTAPTVAQGAYQQQMLASPSNQAQYASPQPPYVQPFVHAPGPLPPQQQPYQQPAQYNPSSPPPLYTPHGYPSAPPAPQVYQPSHPHVPMAAQPYHMAGQQHPPYAAVPMGHAPQHAWQQQPYARY